MQIAPQLNIQDYGNRVDLLGDRIKLELEENETASVIPRPFLIQPIPPEKNYHLPVTQLKMVKYTSQDPMQRIADFEGNIKDHVETKIQLFFSQLLLASGIGLKFYQEKAYYQAGLKTRRKIEEEVTSDFKDVEAHCATLVSLFASDRANHNNCFTTEDNPIEQIFFGDETFYGRSWNMTTTLPACVNLLDSTFEFQYKSKRYANKTFRKCCIKLLNNASKGTINSMEGLIHYIYKGMDYLIRVKEIQTVGFKARIIDIYLEVFNKYWELTKGEKALKTFKTLSFSVLSEGPINLVATHNFMIGKLREEVIMERKLFGISQRIAQLLDFRNDKKKDLRITTKGVALEKTSSVITRWIEGYFSENRLDLTDTSRDYVERCLSNDLFRWGCFQYLNGKTTVDLDADFRNGIKVAPLSILVESIENCLSTKKFKKKKEILVHSLHRISKSTTVLTAQGVNVRQHICLSDHMMEKILEGHPQRRGYLRKANADAQVQALAALL